MEHGPLRVAQVDAVVDGQLHHLPAVGAGAEVAVLDAEAHQVGGRIERTVAAGEGALGAEPVVRGEHARLQAVGIAREGVHRGMLHEAL